MPQKDDLNQGIPLSLFDLVLPFVGLPTYSFICSVFKGAYSNLKPHSLTVCQTLWRFWCSVGEISKKTI